MRNAATASAPARTSLAGNPSDGYGGAVVAVTLPGLVAQVRVAQPERSGGRESPLAYGWRAPIPLVSAAAARFDVTFGSDSTALAVRWRTAIPRSVGLAGSSAIVIATLRALAAHHGIDPPSPERLAALALAVEREDLGIAGGVQDQLVQAHGGLRFHELDPARGGPRGEALDSTALPPLTVAWVPGDGEPSGIAHGDLRRRYSAGEQKVHRALDALATAGRAAREALLTGDLRGLAQAVDRSFDLRATLMALDPCHVRMIEVARAAGAAANYTGSGGAIVAVCRDAAHATNVGDALRAGGYDVL